MRHSILVLGGVLALVFSSAMAGPYTATKNRACPDAWENTEKAIPIVYSSTNPWLSPPPASRLAWDSPDKRDAFAHLQSSRPIETVDKQPVTNIDLLNDPLTVASECLVYRNFEVDTYNYVAPPPIAPNVATGWIPAAIF